ncbi:hypothetical protein [Streptomyces chiangmaiensis]|uniref:Uncharacterized protein n=1 Tax=Streptomyces chiangmaiensis TaxID=766497 RepID=A0ABU7FED5_9ACTN|nr:hypothetical protein [Streptomyces chiangmaiensis]MED7821499.1 hypothetical protein [Streptomyces chiangmaiensis]
MFEHELHHIRSAELIRQAELYRLSREALRGRRDARRTGQEPEREGGDHSHDRHRPRRVARTA